MSELINALTGGLQAALGYQAIFFVLLAVGLNVHFGYTGLLNFGQAAFALLGAFGLAVSVVRVGAALVGRHPRRHRAPASCSLCCSGSRRCACGPTTSPSSPSRRPRSCGWSSGRSGPRPSPAAPEDCRASTPASWRWPPGRADASTTSSACAGAAPSCGSRSSAGSSWRCAACSCGPSCAVRGAGSSRRSVRTRTPPARSGRTSTRTRCRRSSSVVSSGRSAGSSTRWASAR